MLPNSCNYCHLVPYNIIFPKQHKKNFFVFLFKNGKPLQTHFLTSILFSIWCFAINFTVQKIMKFDIFRVDLQILLNSSKYCHGSSMSCIQFLSRNFGIVFSVKVHSFSCVFIFKSLVSYAMIL